MNVLIGLAVSADFLFRFIFCFFLSCFVLTKSCSYPFRITIWYLIFGLCWKSVYAWRKHRNFSAPQNNKNNPNFRSTVINCTKFLLILSLRLIFVFPFALFFALSFLSEHLLLQTGGEMCVQWKLGRWKKRNLQSSQFRRDVENNRDTDSTWMKRKQTHNSEHFDSFRAHWSYKNRLSFFSLAIVTSRWFFSLPHSCFVLSQCVYNVLNSFG